MQGSKITDANDNNARQPGLKALNSTLMAALCRNLSFQAIREYFLDTEGLNLLSTIDNKQQVIKELASFRST